MQRSTADLPGQHPIPAWIGFALVALVACTPAPPPAPPPALPPPPIASPAPSSPPAPEPPPIAATEPADTRCTCPEQPLPPAIPDIADAEDDDVPEDLQARRARTLKKLPKPLAARLRAALPDLRPACDVTAAGPCTLRADFDGDGVPDDAILVRSPHNAGGIAILWGNGGTDLLGAGRHQCWLTSEQADLDGSPVAEPCLEPIDPDLAWISRWSLLTRTPADPAPILRRPGSTKSGHPAPGALGDALLLDSGDAATALYRTSSGWTLMHLGY